MIYERVNFLNVCCLCWLIVVVVWVLCYGVLLVEQFVLLQFDVYFCVDCVYYVIDVNKFDDVEVVMCVVLVVQFDSL